MSALPIRTLFALLLAATCVAAVSAVPADALQEAQHLLQQGQLQQALDRADQVIAGKPGDAQARFLKGVILAEMNRHDEAIAVFSRLSEDYPELPEPYNNLAVIYAQTRQYEKAKAALEMAIRTHPGYATAYENLGDVYARLAGQAYDKALQLDASSTAARSKLAMARELIAVSGRPQPAKAATTTGKPAPGAAPSTAPGMKQ